MPDESVIWTKLNEIYARVLDLDDVQLQRSTSATDIPEWDSVTHVQLMIAVEKTFGFRLKTVEMAALSNVGELVDLISTRATK